MKTRRTFVMVALAGALLGLYALAANQRDRPDTQTQQRVTVEIDDSKAVATYANVCRVTATREEVFLDFAVNSHLSGQAQKPIPVNRRIIVNLYTAKRMLYAVNLSVQRHEAVFGRIDLDAQAGAREEPHPARESRPGTTPSSPPSPEAQKTEATAIALDDSQMLASYANFCRVTGTPEELILDFGLNPQPIGTPTQPIPIAWRVVTNFTNAKRLMLAMESAIQRHEAEHGVLETDVQKRVKRR